MKKKSLVSGVITVMFFSVVAKFLSFFIELLVAYRFGASEKTDVYYLVLGIMQILTPMITVGIWKVFMPAYKEQQIKGNASDTKGLSDQMIFVFTTICCVLILVLEIIPQPVIYIFAPGFTGTKLQLAISLLRIMSPMLIFITMAVFHSAILQANRDFTKSQIKYVLQHVPVLIYLVIFTSSLSVKQLSFVLVVGEALAFIMVRFFTRKEYKFSISRSGISSNTKKVFKLIPAACLNSVINQINHIVDKAFGSILPTGSLTYLTYGNKLVSLFDGIVTTAFSTAFFPYLAELNAKGDEEGLKNFLSQYIVILLCILIPVMFIMVLYSENMVKIVFGYGQFDDYSVNQTAIVLLVYSISLIAMGMNTLLNDIFYIEKKTSMLATTNIINILINLILDFVFVNRFGIIGLCLATTISLYLTMIIKALFIKEQFSFGENSISQIIMIFGSCIIASCIPIGMRIMHLVTNMYIEFFVGTILFLIVYGILIFRPGTEFNKIVVKYLLKKKNV